MEGFFYLLFTEFQLLLSVLDRPLFSFAGFDISLLGILIAGLIISFFVGVLWKGAKG